MKICFFAPRSALNSESAPQVHWVIALGSTKSGDRKSELVLTGRTSFTVSAASAPKKKYITMELLISDQTSELSFSPLISIKVHKAFKGTQ